MGVTHPHSHAAPRPTRASQRTALGVALAANGVFMFVEIVGGIAFGSLALLADAGHMASDVVALSIALAAQRLMERPASARHTYGFQRIEVLGARSSLTLRYGPMGLARFGSASLRLVKRDAETDLVVSSYGRVSR